MITKLWITGDTHGNFSRFKNYPSDFQKDDTAALIILGDAGLNWTLGEEDSHMKNFLSKTYNFRIYCIRGNHEARPVDVPGMELIFDNDVCGEIYFQKKWPNIRYFKDFGIYNILGYTIGIIGGAYSVDKWYRLEHGYTWYENEQLNESERTAALEYFKDKSVDIMLTHTSPLKFEPTDLFLSGIDQSKVDKTMELFLNEIEEKVYYKVWAFGHYHCDRLERPGVEQFYKDTEDIEDIVARWERYDDQNELDWWLAKSPNFYQI